MHAPPAHSANPLLADALGQMEHLGFLLTSPFPGPGGESRLVVTMRAHPTLAHFDPEMVGYWRTDEDGRGLPSELSLGSQPVDRDFSWGKIEVIDRFGIENDFVSLGGHLVAGMVDDVMVADFSSPAPILRMGGHSQAVDRIALELGAFFGRMMVPIDFQPGIEAAISAATPLQRYAAFVAYEQRRYVAYAVLREEHPAQARILAEEATRLRTEHPADWTAGHSLLDRLGLAG
jgi:hypothetical protein